MCCSASDNLLMLTVAAVAAVAALFGVHVQAASWPMHSLN
jgi:hypothetical protein